jgi:FkbM family methyltransferase
MTKIEVLNRDYFEDFFNGAKPGQIYVDVGAYNGDTIDIALKHNPNLKILAIEPSKSLCEAMRQKYISNSNITIVNKAVWSSKVTREFNEYEGWAKGLSTIQPDMIKLRPEPVFTPHILKYPVECDTIDNILSELNIDTVDYIKIDTEGSEEEVLTRFKKYHANTRFHIESHITNLENILQRLLELSAQIDIIALNRDCNIKEHVLSTVVGKFIIPIKKEQQQITAITGISRRPWIHQQIKPEEKILDIGSADGWIFKDTDFVQNVTSIDLDQYDFPNFIRMDAQNLTFEDNSFDIAVMGEILEHVGDPIRVLKEANRVARRIIITVPDEANWDKQWYPYDTVADMTIRRGMTLEQIAKVSNPNAKEFYQDKFKHLFHERHYTEETLRHDIEKAGISNYEMNRLMYQGWSFFVVTVCPKENIEKKAIITCPDKKLRIALISTPFFTVPPSGYSGLEQIVWDLAEALDESGHDVTIFAPDGSKATKHGHVIHTGPSVNTVNVNWLKEEERMYVLYKSIITPEKFDIVHGHDWFGFEFLLKINNPKLNIVHTHHGHCMWDTLPPVQQPNIVTISDFMKTGTELHFKQKGYNVGCSVVYNGIDLSKYPFVPGRRNERLLFVGRLDKFKQPHLAIEVARKLNLGLDIVGGSFVQDNNYLNQIKSMCDGVQIRLYLDASHEQKISLMQTAKCLLFPSQMGEPFGLVACEMMSTGGVVVALNDGAIEEVIGSAGIVCDVFDKKWADNGVQYGLKCDPLQALIDGVQKVHNIKPEDCRKRAKEFSREIMAKNYEKLYHSIMV